MNMELVMVLVFFQMFMKDHNQYQNLIKLKLKEGMILSNEPGYYKKIKFGIRIENLIYVKKIKKKYFLKI